MSSYLGRHDDKILTCCCLGMAHHYPADIEKYVNSNVLLGDDNYLFLWQGSQNQFDFLTRSVKPSKTSIRNFSQNINSRKAYLDRFGIEYKHIIFPSKPTVLEDLLPLDLRVKSLYESYYEKMNCISYSRKKLVAQHSKGRKPFRTLDTHLTDYGFISCLQDALPDDFKLIKEKGFSYKSVKKLLAGDLEIMIRKESKLTVPEHIIKEVDAHGANIEFEECDNIKDISGNTGNIVIIKGLNSFTNKRLLVFGDSFIRKGLRLLSPIYSEIIYFRSQFFRPELINLFRPDMVLSANAERYLSNVQNDDETTFWCSSNFKNPSNLSNNKHSIRLLHHLRGLSSRYFDQHKYQAYINETSCMIRNQSNFKGLTIDQWFSESRQISCAIGIVDKLALGLTDSLPKIKFDPVQRTSPSNGSIRSLATYVYRSEIHEHYLSTQFVDDLLISYDPYILTILCLLRIENILIHSISLSLTTYQASELFCSCNILAKLLESDSQNLRKWITNVFDILIDNSSKRYLPELFKACYLFRPYLHSLKLALPQLINTIHLRDKLSLENYFDKVNSLDESSPEFVELIKGKSVAIVGPSSSGQSLGHEIDTFDTVIRMSADNLAELDPSITGLKTTISYFSGHTADSQQKIINLANQIPCISVSLPKFAPLLFRQIDKCFVPNFSHVRQTVMLKHVSKLQIYTSPNLLQVILLDILRYAPSRVKVFYSNMFAKKTYDSNYKSVKSLRKRSGSTQSYSLSSLTMLNHDPISNFLLIKSFYKNLFFEADPILSEVIHMEPEQYLDSLQSSITLRQEVEK